MAIDWQDVLTNIGTTLVSDVVVVGAAAWIIKTLISDRLARESEKFKIQVKADVDREIERLKAFLTRAARVHERQLEILQKLYRHLYETQGLFQRMTSSEKSAPFRRQAQCASAGASTLSGAAATLLRRIMIRQAMVETIIGEAASR